MTTIGIIETLAGGNDGNVSFWYLRTCTGFYSTIHIYNLIRSNWFLVVAPNRFSDKSRYIFGVSVAKEHKYNVVARSYASVMSQTQIWSMWSSPWHREAWREECCVWGVGSTMESGLLGMCT